MDVDNDDSVRAGVANVIAQHGRVDALVAAAGWGLAGPVETTTLDEARAQVETNFWGAVRVTNAVLPHFRENGGGRLLFISSLGGLIAVPFQSYYSASKFALEGWAEALAYEVTPFNIDVTLVEPGNFKTDFTDSRREAAAPAGPYQVALDHAIAVMAHDERNGAAPAAVAAIVSKQLNAKKPRRRVSVGKFEERIGVVGKRGLPYRWFELAAKDSLGIE
jgi:NAD(P)-dependent dehydrogenase (short-subunit alcohol dehydrogenase family)